MQRIYRISHPRELRKAGPTSLIELEARPNPLILPRSKVDLTVSGIASGYSAISISGPTGTGKSMLVNALADERNLIPLCEDLEIEAKPVKLYSINLQSFESSSDLLRSRELIDGNTRWYPSTITAAIRDAREVLAKGTHRPVLYFMEVGRIRPDIQNGLLHIINRDTEIVLPDECLSTEGITMLLDSNYQGHGSHGSYYALTELDTALRRRLCLSVTMGYLPAEHEEAICRRLLEHEGHSCNAHMQQIIRQTVRLGSVIRTAKADGSFYSLGPPTIESYLTAIRLSLQLPGYSLWTILENTLLGMASEDDHKRFPELFSKLRGGDETVEKEIAVSPELF